MYYTKKMTDGVHLELYIYRFNGTITRWRQRDTSKNFQTDRKSVSP